MSDSLNSDEITVRTSRSTVLDLNEDCWRLIMDYLDVEDLLSIASTNGCIRDKCGIYASYRYKHIESLKIRNSDDLQQLLQLVGQHLVSYKLSYPRLGDDKKLLWLLRSHCTNIENLKIALGSSDEWNDLYSLKKLKYLDVFLCFNDESLYTKFVYNLKQFTCLRKLKLECNSSYSGEGLPVLDQLECLDLDNVDELDAKILVDCCQRMKQLRCLSFHNIENMSKQNFKHLATNSQQLERLSFDGTYFDCPVPYELLCQLPRLQHLSVAFDGPLRNSFIEGLINKRGVPLESLLLFNSSSEDRLSDQQIRHLSNISTLKELYVSCDTVPLADLMKLRNLLYLHISMPSITNDQILNLLKGLPRLKVLYMKHCYRIDEVTLKNSVRTWVSKQRKRREKIKIYIGLHSNGILYADPLIEIISGIIYPILINTELGERDQN